MFDITTITHLGYLLGLLFGEVRWRAGHEGLLEQTLSMVYNDDTNSFVAYTSLAGRLGLPAGWPRRIVKASLTSGSK